VKRSSLHVSVAAAAFAVCGFLTGCTLTSTATPSAQAFEVSGSVYGGALPINGSHIYLYVANQQGLAGPGIAPSTANVSTSILVNKPGTTADANGHYYVTSGATGGFSLSGDYPACSTGQELYLYATGGNARGGDPTLTGGNNGVNAAIGLLSDLGECSTIGTGTKVTLNELSTVAAGYALAGYASDATHIGDDEGLNSNSTAALAKTGMANAFANARDLVTLGGAALSTTPSGNGTVPTATLNTIANILAGCVQSAGPTSKDCTDLFSFTGTGSTSDTATATINLAHNPDGVQSTTTGSSGSGSSSITPADLFLDLEPETDFVPNLAKAPNDYSLAILYAGNGITTPVGLAVDTLGDVWIADSGAGSVFVLSGQGASYSATQDTGGGLSTPTEIAIDTNGAAWATNPTSVSQLSGTGSTYTATEHDGGISGPTGIAVDTNNVIWVTNNTGSASAFIPGRTGYTQQTESNRGGDYTGIAVDASNYVWITNSNKEYLRLDINGSAKTIEGSVTGVPTVSGVAIDSQGRAWMNTASESAFTIITPTAGALYTQSTSADDTSYPTGLIFDALNNPWADCPFATSRSVCHLDTGGSGQLEYLEGSTGDGSSGSVVTGTTNHLAFDGSGNLWVSNSNNVAEFVGAGTPVVTPLVEAVIQNKIAARP